MHTQGVLICPIPIFGSIVVNGKLAVCTPRLVAALKNVDLPTFDFPIIPINNYDLMLRYYYI